MRSTEDTPNTTDTPPLAASFGAVLLGLGALYTYTFHGNSYPCAGAKLCAQGIHYSPLVKASILTLASISLVYAVAVRFASWGTATATLAGLLGAVALGYGGIWLMTPIATGAVILPLLGGLFLLGSVAGVVSRRLRRGHEDTSG